MRVMRFGEIVEGYEIPVLNEREIRASAGMLFLFMFTALMRILFRQDFTLIKYVLILFLTDFIIRVLVNPRFSPSLILGRLIVRRQAPEYVGAAPKRFAWTIGLVLATIMFFLMVVLNTYSVISGLICLVCLVFLFFESAFGICLGCLFYGWFHKARAQYCPGEICERKAIQDIQRTSLAQIGIVIGFIAYILLAAFLFRDHLSQPPSNLLIMLASALAK